MPRVLSRGWPHFGNVLPTLSFLRPSCRFLRSDAALEAIAEAADARNPNLVLYNYPSFSGAFSALFAHLFHSRLNLPCLILPFSSVIPFRVDDFSFEGPKECYFLDFIGPQRYAWELSQRTGCKVTCFDHRKSTVPRIPSQGNCIGKLKFHVDLEKCSARAAYDYFSTNFECLKCLDQIGEDKSLIFLENRCRVEALLDYIEDRDLRRWRLPDIQAFGIGIREWHSSNLSCLTNPHLYEQVDLSFYMPSSIHTVKGEELLRISCDELISKGKYYISSRQDAAKDLLHKAFKLRLGRGIYGECLAVRADGHANLADEIGKELCLRSAAVGLRAIGAVVYMQRNNLKMCLRSTDRTTDTSEVAKAYGGGGSSHSSSFMIRMDEYNIWSSA